ncbi:MAG: S41 family peptidase [Treponema sp.]|nr:S41 family peptidase [Treponema sp.]
MRRLGLTLAIGIFLFSVGTLVRPEEQPAEAISRVALPAELRKIINENRRIARPPPNPDIMDMIAGFTPHFDAEEDARVAEILRHRRRIRNWRHSTNLQGIGGTDNLNIYLTHEQAGEEIQFLFDLLRNGYGGYQYFGGDSVFIPIRNALLEQLANMDNPLQVSSYINDLILPALQGVIADNHFWIHDVSFGAPAYVPYMSGEFILRKSEGGFVTEIDGVMYSVLEVTQNAQSVSGILPTLSPEGEFAWAFGLVTMEDQQDDIEISVVFENAATGETHSRMVNLPKIIAAPPRPSYPMVVTREMDGITILESRSFNVRSGNDRIDFLQSGSALRDRPVLIIDLNGNSGGRATYPYEWIRLYTGHEPAVFMLFFRPRSQVSVELQDYFIPYQVSARFRERRAISTIEEPSCVIGFPMQMATIPNENLVIVLIDNNVASAGELFVGHLRQLDNVLFVGTNTKGALIAGNIGRTSLPHSGLRITFGTGLSMRLDLSQFEGVGFMPDLWVPPGESLERVLRFIERYGLANGAFGTVD